MSVTAISPKQLHDLVAAGAAVELIDVRTPAEFREVHVTFARNVPLNQLDAAKLAAGRKNSADPLYVICRSGRRGVQACEQFLAAGYVNIVNVEGGTQAWDQAGLPVVRGKKTISLERQVPIAAGGLVLAATAMGALVHEYWYGLAAAIGAGQMYAGLADNCCMGKLLARMPWNQAPSSSPAGGAETPADVSQPCCG